MLAEIPLTQAELDSQPFSFLTDEETMQTYHSQLPRGCKIPKPNTKTYEAECRNLMPALLRTNITRAQAQKTVGKMTEEEKEEFQTENTTSYSMPNVLPYEDIKFQASAVMLYCSCLYLYIVQHI
jgi:hypothetical protein